MPEDLSAGCHTPHRGQTKQTSHLPERTVPTVKFDEGKIVLLGCFFEEGLGHLVRAAGKKYGGKYTEEMLFKDAFY